ncbi:MAG TPA: oxidoreductase [Acidimicrobiia bacterium]|nr:oxidoreductase [Acidimicrobiia bacterium]
MSWSERDVPDQSGRVALVTGANGGLGFENARALAANNATVILAARDQAKAAVAKDAIEAASPNARLDVRELDLASLESIHALADGIVDQYQRLDILINNAGVMAIPERRTDDGFEMQLGTNHLGHHALTSLLLPLLVRTTGSRVVSVTSTARHFGRPVDPANPHLEGNYDRWRAYGQSKLANLHFAVGLEERFRSSGAPTASLVAHPGLTYTDLQENTAREGGGDMWARLTRRFGMRPPQGALPQLRAATDPRASGGQLYAPRWVNFGPPVRRPLIGRSRNPRAIDTLFAMSASETGLEVDVEAAMR